MQNSAQNYILEVVHDRRHGPLARAIKCFLWTLSQLYGVAVWTRARVYRAGIFRRHLLAIPTISVGNITVGGTGKTPFVEMLAEELSRKGRKVVILSRGYRSTSRKKVRRESVPERHSPAVVSTGEQVLLDSASAGDEPYLLATNLAGVAVLVGKNRVKSGQYAISNLGADVLILDDGFQHLPLRRHLDLVLIDSTDPFGNGHLLPRGILREPLKSLRRADCFVLTKTMDVPLQAIKDRLREVKPDAKVIETIHKPLYLEDVLSGRREAPELIRGKELHVLSAIARPESFESAIARLGARIGKSIRFLDHHRFSESEIKQVLDRAVSDNAFAVITTQKDAVRLPPLQSTPVPILFLRVAIKITRGAEELAELLSRTCQV